MTRYSSIRAVAVLVALLGSWLVGQDHHAVAANTTSVVVHYHRFSADYTGWNPWMWPNQPDALAGQHINSTAQTALVPWLTLNFPAPVPESGSSCASKNGRPRMWGRTVSSILQISRPKSG